MAHVATIASAISTIAAKVNVHQILIEDLKNNGLQTHAPSAADPVDYTQVQRMIDAGLATLKEDLTSRASRDKAMLETGINYSMDQKIATAVPEVHQKALVAIMQEPIGRIGKRIEELVLATNPLANAPRVPETFTAPEPVPDSSNETEPVINQVQEPDPIPVSAASKSRASRRRGKASQDECPGTLTLE